MNVIIAETAAPIIDGIMRKFLLVLYIGTSFGMHNPSPEMTSRAGLWQLLMLCINPEGALKNLKAQGPKTPQPAQGPHDHSIVRQ